MVVAKEQMQEEAIRLFQTYGYKNVSVEMICRSFHVTRGSFYHYFKNKDDLLLQWLYSFTSKLDNPQDQDPSLSAYERMQSQLYTWAEELEKLGPELLHDMIGAVYNQMDPSLQQEETIASFSILPDSSHVFELIQQAQDEGDVDCTQTPRQLERIYSYAVAGLCISWFLSKDVISFTDEVKMIFVRVFGDGKQSDSKT